MWQAIASFGDNRSRIWRHRSLRHSQYCGLLSELRFVKSWLCETHAATGSMRDIIAAQCVFQKEIIFLASDVT